MTREFNAGEVYFRVTYAERSMSYPLIESFVFVGKNLSEEDSEDTWYFQFADSFSKAGSILEGTGGDRRVCCLTESDLGDMLNDEQLLQELGVARTRRSNRGK